MSCAPWRSLQVLAAGIASCVITASAQAAPLNIELAIAGSGGAFTLATNDALHSVSAGGAGTLTMNITSLPNATFARIAGVQLVQTQAVPEPGTLVLVLVLVTLAPVDLGASSRRSN